MSFAILLDYERRENGAISATGEVVWDGDGLIPIFQPGDWLGCPPVATISAPASKGAPANYAVHPAPGGPLIGVDGLFDAGGVLTPGDLQDILFRHTGAEVALFLNGRPATPVEAVEPAPLASAEG